MKENLPRSFFGKITNSDLDVLLISSINYEQRSLEWLRLLNRLVLMDETKKKIVSRCIILDNSDKGIQILNEKIKSNTIYYHQFIGEIQSRISSEDFGIVLSPEVYKISLQSLPTIEQLRLMFDIENNFSKESPCNIVFDISSLPRRVLMACMDFLFKMLEDKVAKSLFIVYSWPKRYPTIGRSTNTGALLIENNQDKLQNFISEINDVHAIIFSGRDGTVGRLFLESLPNEAQIGTYFYVKKDDFLYSYNTILNNSGVISHIERNNSRTLHYYLSVSRGYELVMSRVKSTLNEWNNDHKKGRSRQRSRALLISPFGPKPMMITTIIANRYAEKFIMTNRLENCKVGIVHQSSVQQNDLYSIGFKSMSYYEINLGDILV